jgi:hypothetical protein
MKKTLTYLPMLVIIPIVCIMLGISLFCGVVVVSGGLGGFFPQINQVAGPLVCGSAEMQVEQHVHSYRPGATSYTVSIYCIDPASGAKNDVTGQAQLIAGAIYSLILFLPLLLAACIAGFLIHRGGRKIRQQQANGNY